jgi:hypothetical protein
VNDDDSTLLLDSYVDEECPFFRAYYHIYDWALWKGSRGVKGAVRVELYYEMNGFDE